MAIQWFYETSEGQQSGPVDSRELRRLAEADIVRPETLVCQGASGRWVHAEQVQGLFQRSSSSPVVSRPLPPPVPESATPSKGVRGRPRRRNTLAGLIKVVAGGVAGLALGWMILWFGFGTDPLGIMSVREAKSGGSQLSGAASELPAPAHPQVTANEPEQIHADSDDTPAALPPNPFSEGQQPATRPAEEAPTEGQSDTPSKQLTVVTERPVEDSSEAPPAEAPPKVVSTKPNPDKLPLPKEDATSKTLVEIKKIFKQEYASATTPDQRRSLAELLHKQAVKSEDDRLVRFVLLQQAFDYATAAGDLPLAERITSQLTSEYAIDDLQLRVHMLTRVFDVSRSASASKEIAGRALTLAEQAVHDKRFEEAAQLARLAKKVVVRTRDPDLRRRAVAISDNVEQASREWGTVQRAIELLKEKPDDPLANLFYGKHLCIVNDDWREGLPLLAKCSDDAIKAAASADLANPSEVEGRMAVADMWYEVAGRKDSLRGFRVRARKWYSEALPDAVGINRLKAERRLGEMPKIVGSPHPSRPPRGPVVSKSSPLVAPFSSEEAKAVRNRWSRVLRHPEEFENAIGMRLILIPPGEFMMGSGESAEKLAKEFGRTIELFTDEHPQHRVRITKPFYLGMTEVTQGQWESVMGTRPWSGARFGKEGSDYAATYVSWKEAVEYCRRLTAKAGAVYRLPTEAEWEYACRAGTTTMWIFGNDVSNVGEYAWTIENTNDVGEGYPHRVGQKPPNPFGLYDMHGNVFEWCSDLYDEDYYSGSPMSDPMGPTTGSLRVIRGGGWLNHDWHARSASRAGKSSSQNRTVGFRVVRSLSGVFVEVVTRVPP